MPAKSVGGLDWVLAYDDLERAWQWERKKPHNPRTYYGVEIKYLRRV